MELQRPEAGAALFISTLGITLNFGVSARIHGPLELGQLEAALAGLGRRHPLLAVRAAAREDGTPYFTDKGVRATPLRVVERLGDDDWVGEMERDIQQPTAYLEGPLIRCVWLRGQNVSDVVLVCDHLAADGRAAIFALRDLLALLAAPSDAVETIDSPPLYELVPPDVARQIIEDAAAAGYPTQEEIDEARSQDASDSESAEPEYTLPAEPVCIQPFFLDAEETSALVRRCRAEEVTVQAALCAAFLTPFAEGQPDRPVRRAEIPVDLRPRLSRPVGDAYGNMIGLTLIDVDCTPGLDLWATARNAAAALAGMRDRDLFATPLVVIPLAGRYPNRPWMIDYDLSISNLGRVEIPEVYGELRLESIYGPVFPATGPEHLILGISTFAGQMRCTFSSRGLDSAPLLARGRELLRMMVG
jgi:hypothetical protein